MSYSFSNEHGIVAMGGVPVASVEYSHGIFTEIWQRLEEADEAALVVDLAFPMSDSAFRSLVVIRGV